MAFVSLLVVVGSVAVASAFPSQNRVALESDIDIALHSRGWTRGLRASPNTTLSMTFAIKQQNTNELTKTLLAVSDPNHPNYGKHLTKDQVDKLIAPSQESVETVQRFIRDNGIQHCQSSQNYDFLTCNIPVRIAEKMLQVEYFEFQHNTQPAQVIRAASHYTVPSDVAPHLDLISPTNRMPSLSKEVKKTSLKEPLRTNTPKSLRALYNVGDTVGKAPSNRLCCTAFLKQYFHQRDLDKFWKEYWPSSSGQTITVVGPDDGFPGIEASLDIEYITTMGGNIPAEFWSFAGHAPDNDQNEPFLTWIYLVANTSDAKVPKVFSTSYGEPEDTVSMAYMNRIEIEFQKTGARGITLFFASGDSGVAPDGGECKNGRFAGQWPAGSPWVTGVGGTEGGDVGVAESAWSGSSGGFSDRWPVADFQKNAVEKYLSTATLPDKSHFNSTSRGFPDVAAQATDFLVINGGFPTPVAGTSCASPTFTGIFALLNDLRLQAGKSTLGYVNPLFYQNPTMFNDITKGSNGAGIGCGGKGFEAIAGWDPVTGLGTPNYEAMAKVVSALP